MCGFGFFWTPYTKSMFCTLTKMMTIVDGQVNVYKLISKLLSMWYCYLAKINTISCGVGNERILLLTIMLLLLIILLQMLSLVLFQYCSLNTILPLWLNTASKHKQGLIPWKTDWSFHRATLAGITEKAKSWKIVMKQS